jgi:malate dehydrogenase (oxaloacetate-decarboxylating)
MNFRRIRDDKTAEEILEVSLAGQELLRNPSFNKGLGFTIEERRELGLDGLLPPRVLTLEEDIALAYEQYLQKKTDLERHVYLNSLHDRNETLFFALLLAHLKEMVPIVYTPVVGDAVENYSHMWRHPRGIFITLPQKDRIDRILETVAFADKVEAIVVTDSEAILGIGDQGAGGMGISIGKLALYTACGGLYPETTLPVALDVGTDNDRLLRDPLYLGWRHPRMRGAEYDDFLDAFVSAVIRKFPGVLLQFEDFGTVNARALIERHHDRLCTFNDDIQGTGAVTLASLMAAMDINGSKLGREQIVIVGGGSGGTGIADQIVTAMVAEGLTTAEAISRIWFVGRQGLMLSNMHDPKYPYRRKYAQPPERVRDWKLRQEGPITLFDVMRNLHPAAVIGTSAQPGYFSEEIVREMTSHVKRPIIFPLSNPLTKSEAVPSDLLAWTQGRALIATGSPFADVEYGGRKIRISQCNNSFIFPGLALGVIATRARRIRDEMLTAAATALAECSPSRNDPAAPLLPPLDDVRLISRKVAMAVGAEAQRLGVAEKTSAEELERRVAEKMWTPRYPRVKRAKVL